MSRIKELRKAAGLSQTQLAKIVNVDQTAVSKWELGKSFPDMGIAIELADYFHVSVDSLLGRPDESQNESAFKDALKLSDIEFALYGEVRELDDEDIAELLRNAQRMRELSDLRKQQKERSK